MRSVNVYMNCKVARAMTVTRGNHVHVSCFLPRFNFVSFSLFVWDDNRDPRHPVSISSCTEGRLLASIETYSKLNYIHSTNARYGLEILGTIIRVCCACVRDTQTSELPLQSYMPTFFFNKHPTLAPTSTK